MNRSLLPLLTLSLLGSLSMACSSSSSPSSTSIGEATSNLARNTSPSVPASDMTALVAGNSDFAVRAYQSIANQPGTTNAFMSPYSISSALAMTYAGANGQTATEMATAMDYTLAQAQLHPAFDALDLALASRASAPTENGAQPLQLHIANTLFGYEKDVFGKPFLDTIAVNYGAGVQLVDFQDDPDGCRTEINSWISSQTDSKIQNMLAPGTITSDTRLALVDAIYFDGNWASPFDKTQTHNVQFTKIDGTTVSVPLMFGGPDYAPVAQTATYDAAELAYAGNAIVMDIVMPKAGTFAAFEAAMTGDSLTQIFAGLQSGPVNLSLPKFQIAGDTISLKTMLQSFGMNVAFTPAADFTAITTDPVLGPIYIGDVLHKAFVSVDEDGTQAAAATVVLGVGTAGAPSNITTISFDHPFFFSLRDQQTGAIIFAGRVEDPSN